MNFIHEDPDFNGLLKIVAEHQHVSAGLVEKDYWVTHALWTLSQTRLEVWFKGGTSLSKAFGLIQRFSEDLDLRIEPGSEAGLPSVKNWKSTNAGPIAQRRNFYEALETKIKVPGAILKLDLDKIDSDTLSANYHLEYPGKFLKELPPPMRPFVMLEVGVARVTPFVKRSLSSFVHDWLDENHKWGNYKDNRPHDVRCVHPFVTLIEKIDAIVRRYPRINEDPASFIRHYEDAARIIQAEKSLPALEMELRALVRDMVAQKQIRGIPTPKDPAFALSDRPWCTKLEKAHQAIGFMFWAKRLSLQTSCGIIRKWLKGLEIR